jgi:hypothetical protein
MTRDEALALCYPNRASVRRILNAAVPACNRSDLIRALPSSPGYGPMGGYLCPRATLDVAAAAPSFRIGNYVVNMALSVVTWRFV